MTFYTVTSVYADKRYFKKTLKLLKAGCRNTGWEQIHLVKMKPRRRSRKQKTNRINGLCDGDRTCTVQTLCFLQTKYNENMCTCQPHRDGTQDKIAHTQTHTYKEIKPQHSLMISVQTQSTTRRPNQEDSTSSSKGSVRPSDSYLMKKMEQRGQPSTGLLFSLNVRASQGAH